jgi:hypothetical protein
MPTRPVVELFLSELRAACATDAFGAWEPAMD